MTGPVYYSIWLFVGTLYPAYESFKAVKTKNTRNYVSNSFKIMNNFYKIFIFSGTMDDVLDCVCNIFSCGISSRSCFIFLVSKLWTTWTLSTIDFCRVPFYSESKIIFFLYLVSSSTRGSSTIYRHFIHPTLCNNEAEIDLAINKFKSKTVQTLKQWISAAFQKFGKWQS